MKDTRPQDLQPADSSRPDPDAAIGAGVVLLRNAGDGFGCRYEREARRCLAERLAGLKGLAFVGEGTLDGRAGPGCYFVPDDTLTCAQAERLGIRSEHDLFGGVVPHPFVATKAITQPLIDREADAPEGWSMRFHEDAPHAVLRGFTVFSAADAQRAAARLLRIGPFRTKPVRATGGRGQAVVRDLDALQAQLDAIDPASLARDGLVLEENLDRVETLSIGRVVVGELVASYYGRQRLTTDNTGEEAYGGSTLTLVRGDFDGLAGACPDEATRIALAQARSYDARARESFPGLLLSRSNYDVAQGVDAGGRPRSGVLEQSWRLGGATPAEVVALEALRAEPGLRWVRASCHEVYGACTPPADALVLFSGEDGSVGRITLYAVVEDRG